VRQGPRPHSHSLLPLDEPRATGTAQEKPGERQTCPESRWTVGLHQGEAEEHGVTSHIGGKHPPEPQVAHGIEVASDPGEQQQQHAPYRAQ
jgi:hypothetical protein